MKYQTQIADLGTKLTSSKTVLIVLPSALTIDKLAASLSLKLSLEKAGKSVAVVTDGSPLVSHTNLYGVGDIKNKLPEAKSGDLTLKLEGVVDNTGKVPGLDKLDWYPEGNDLNLVFHVLPGQKFEPYNIIHKYSDQGFDLIFAVGVNTLSELGQVYIQNLEIFNKSTIVNIDNKLTNTLFGQYNIVDPEAGSISEVILGIAQDLNFTLDPDILTNVVAGIYNATSNLVYAKPNTFMSLAFAMQNGARLPQPNVEPIVEPQTITPTAPVAAVEQTSPQVQPQVVAPQPPLNLNPQTITPQVVPQTPIQSNQPLAPQVEVNNPQVQPQTQTQPQAQPANFDFTQFIKSAPPPISQPFNNMPPLSPTTPPQNPQPQNQTLGSGSPEERPVGEYAQTPSQEVENPAPDWLTPKIFKGGNIN